MEYKKFCGGRYEKDIYYRCCRFFRSLPN